MSYSNLPGARSTDRAPIASPDLLIRDAGGPLPSARAMGSKVT